MGGRGADGGRGRRAGGPRRREPALQSGSPGGAGGAGGGRRRRSSAAPPPRPPARSLERRPIAPAAAGGSRPPPAGARRGQGPGRWAAPGSGGRRGGGPGRRRRELAGCSRSRRTASPRCVPGDERREARRGPLGSLRVVSQNRPEVRGGPWGRLGGPTARPGRGAGVRLGRCARAPEPGVKEELSPFVLKVIDRLKGYPGLVDASTKRGLSGRAATPP